MEPSYQISTGKIAHENIDGEIIVIHYDTGDYYSMSGTAAVLWQMMSTPQSLDRIRARFASWDGRAETSVTRFLDVLVGEGLIHATEDASGGTAGAPGQREGERLAFQDPVVEKYSDMKTILLADPIHDVEEEGWPKVKAQS
jgi:hypothetical protein